MRVTKLVGTGNDFLFIDGRSALPGAWGRTERPEIVRRLCDRHFGLGADGLVFVEDGRWDFYNTDGSHAEMCGNATRCFGRWASLNMGVSDVTFTTIAGPVRVSVEGDTVRSFLNFVHAHPRLERLQVAGRDVSVYWIDTGVPHFVAKLASIDERDMEIIRELRWHKAGGPRGANVTLLEVVGPQSFKTVTYERGVEDFTLSCGTGVIAAAAVGLMIEGSQSLEAHVQAPGGELDVRFEKGFDGVTLIGPAVKVFETELDESLLR